MTPLLPVFLAALASAPEPVPRTAHADAAALTDLLERTDRAERAAHRTAGTRALADALARFHDLAPALAADSGAQRARLMAQLSLARALLYAGDADGATAAVDEALRISRGATFPQVDFGPDLAELYAERRAALSARGTGTIDVECLVPCRVLIDETGSPARATGLLLGTYRVWIEATRDVGVGPLKTEVELSTPDASTVLTFPDRPPPERAAAATSATPAEPARHRIDRPSRTAHRMLPRWVEIVGVVIGAASVATGAVLLHMDGQCTTEACDDIYDTDVGGIISLSAGGAFLVAGTVTLAVDEVRVRRNRPTARAMTVGYRFRF